MRIISALLLLFFLPVLPYGSEFKDIVRELENFSLDYCHEIKIDSLHIDLTSAAVELHEGRLQLIGFIDDKPTAAFFTGNGNFRYFPPDAVEAQQVERFYGDDIVDIRFEQLYLATPAVSDIIDNVQPGKPALKISGRQKRHIKEIRSIPPDKFKYDLSMHVARALIEGKHDYLWLDIYQGGLEHTVYLYDPYVSEQVSIFKISPKFRKPQWVSSYHDTAVTFEESCRSVIDILHYDVDVDISTYSKSGINCTMSIEIVTDSLKIVALDFPAEYTVDYIRGDVLDSLSFFKEKDWPGLAFELSRCFYRGDTVRIGLSYKTNMFYHYMDAGVVPENLIHWYPYNGFRDMSTYSVRYSIDDGYGFIAVGDRVNDESKDGKRMYEYTTADVAYISFNYGLFDTLKVVGTEKPISIFYLSGKHDSPLFGNPNIGKIADDISQSFEFYADKFIPYRFSDMAVVAISTWYGQGSPGVVYLPSSTFMHSRPGFDDKLRAHEVAHQWWGHTVNPASYRDAWLSEGLAEYSAALFIRETKEDKKAFPNILKDWRNKILQRGRLHGQKSDGYRAGAICLGTRLRSEISPGDYESIVYYKAAYMLHMLGIELEDITGDKDALYSLLAEFITRHAGQSATTGDFIKVAYGYLGERTGQFFARWLYDWRIPQIESDYEITENGTAVVDIKVDEVSSEFMTCYPVRFNFNDGTHIDTFFDVKYGENRFIYKPPEGVAIESVDFNSNFDTLEK